MKKKLLALLTCGMMFFVSACTSSDVMVLTPYGDAIIKDDAGAAGQTAKPAQETKEVKEEAKPETQAVESSSDLIKVGFAQVGSESDWRMAQTQSMKEAFTKENGFEFTFVNCNNDPDVQKQTISDFVDQKLQYIILDPIMEDGYEEVLTKAKDANIPVIVVDRNISADSSLYTCWVGSDFAQEGADAASWLAEYLEKNGRGSEDINILTILGSEGASATIGREKGFADKMLSNWKMLDAQSGDFTEEGGFAVMNAFLKQYQDIDVVVCQNDNEAYGAADAIKQAGLTCGPQGDIIIISFDATKGGFQRMIDGDINVDVECNPLEGPTVAELIKKLHNGETVEPIQYMKEGVYPAETAAQTIGSRSY